MTLLRRFWAPLVIILIVATHAAVIFFVRNRISQLTAVQSSTMELGTLRFQNIEQPNAIFEFRMHAAIDPAKYFQGQERLTQMRVPIIEASEQTLRQLDEAALSDPAHVRIRERLLEIVTNNLEEPLVQRILITEWLRLSATAK